MTGNTNIFRSQLFNKAECKSEFDRILLVCIQNLQTVHIHGCTVFVFTAKERTEHDVDGLNPTETENCCSGTTTSIRKAVLFGKRPDQTNSTEKEIREMFSGGKFQWQCNT